MKTLELNNLTDSQSELMQSLFNEFTKMNTKTNDNLDSLINEIIIESDELLKEKERVSLVEKEFTTLLIKQIDEDVAFLNKSLPKLNLKAEKSGNGNSVIYIRVINDPACKINLDYKFVYKENKFGLSEVIGIRLYHSHEIHIGKTFTSVANNISEMMPIIKNRLKKLYEISLKK